jgi:hypothetical protein
MAGKSGEMAGTAILHTQAEEMYGRVETALTALREQSTH